MRKVPELRFAGFDGEWEEKKLSNIVKINSGRDYKHLSEGKYPVYGTGGLMTYVSEFLSDVDSVGIGRKGTINKPQKLEAPFWTVDTLFYATPIKDYNLDYIYSVFQIINWLKYDESTGLPSLSKTNINNIRIYNAGVQEQEKIGNLFKKIDALIEIQEGKVAKMRDYKKSMLQKIFPKKGELVPEFRFDGFDGEWNTKALGDLSEISTGKLDANAMVPGGEYDFYTSGIEKYKIDNYAFEGSSITVAGNGATVGYMHLADGKFNAYQRTYVIQKIKGDRIFIFYQIQSKLPRKIHEESRQGNIPYIVMNMLTDLYLDVPEIEEQAKIGQFFKNLDIQIENEEKLLDSYKMMKKSLLQKMFV